MNGYEPRPGSVAERAIAHLRALPAGTLVSTTALVRALGGNANGLYANLQVPTKHGLLVRESKGRWRLGDGTQAAPPQDVDDDDDAGDTPQQRIVSAWQCDRPIGVFRDPLAVPEGIRLQSEKEGRGRPRATAEPPPLPATSPKPPGLDWKAPAVPVFIQAGPFTNADVDEVSESNTPPKGAKAATASVQREVGADATPKDGAAPQGSTPMQEGFATPEDRAAPAHKAGGVSKGDGTLASTVSAQSTARFALWSNGALEIRRETVADAADFILLAPDETRALLRYLERIAVGEDAC